MSTKKHFYDQASALVIQKHQLNAAEGQVGIINSTLETLHLNTNSAATTLDSLIAHTRSHLQYQTIDLELEFEDDEIYLIEKDKLIHDFIEVNPLKKIDYIDFNQDASFSELVTEFQKYCDRNHLALANDPFSELMTPTQRIALEKKIQEDFSFKKSQCDKYDYMIAGTCGLIGGLMDVLLVGMPGQGFLTTVADNITDEAVQKFAKLNGWNGAKEGSDPMASAIGFLERKFKVNYDHAHTGAVGGEFQMNTKNHHIKSLGHSPDLVGLFFSILDQFNSTAHFVSDGKLVSIDTKTFELKGSTIVFKIFSGFYNWLGHLFSDMAGSSGASGRGSGIPIPFYSLLQFIDVGEFGQHRQTFATIAVRVFQEGYDMRHGLAMAMPVIITELLTRLMWVVKQRYYHQQPWEKCIPTASNAELRRMLLVAHGSLCLVDTTDAALRSGGDLINFMLRSNMIAWIRFGTLAMKEVKVWYGNRGIDPEAVDAYLEADYRRMLGT